jgi:hypothetical protein
MIRTFVVNERPQKRNISGTFHASVPLKEMHHANGRTITLVRGRLPRPFSQPQSDR